MKKDKILVTGAGGQIGTVLVNTLRKTYGDCRRPLHNAISLSMPHFKLHYFTERLHQKKEEVDHVA